MIHVYVWLNLFPVHLKLSQFCSLAICQYKIKVLKILSFWKMKELYECWSLEILKSHWADIVWTFYLEGREYSLDKALTSSEEILFPLISEDSAPSSQASPPPVLIILHVHIWSRLWESVLQRTINSSQPTTPFHRSMWCKNHLSMNSFNRIFLCNENHTTASVLIIPQWPLEMALWLFKSI